MSTRADVPDKVTTNVTLDRSSWEWLRRQAHERSLASGDRASASLILRELIQRAAAERDKAA